MVQVYNSRYLGGGNWEDHSLRPAKIYKTPSQSMAGCGGTHLSSHLCENKRVAIQAGMDIK
jgi:hypothetical protein